MAGDSRRKLKPRPRNYRPVEVHSKQNNGPKNTPEPPEEDSEGWFVKGGIANRLFQKSAIGRISSEQTLRLSGPELMFCHWHRHLPLPHSSWIEEQLSKQPLFLHECAAFESARDGGEKVVIRGSLSELHSANCAEQTWAMRWNRNQHPSRNEPLSEMRWFASQSSVDWRELVSWSDTVSDNGHKAEILVVDGEFDVTIYRISNLNLSGEIEPPQITSDLIENLKNHWIGKEDGEIGSFLPNSIETWPLKNIGVPQTDGIWLDDVERGWIEDIITENDSNEIVDLYSDLISRGLLCKPGFKYGCRWRIYSNSMEEEHAPWLLSHESEAPVNWDGACLSVRLAAGVHKIWVCALNLGQKGVRKWNYFSLERILIGRD